MASIESRGPRQMLQAFGYSMQGLRAAWRYESSFRLESYLFCVLAPLALWLGGDAIEKALMLGVAVAGAGGGTAQRRDRGDRRQDHAGIQ
jgi:diacylglycerol kinase